MKGSISNSEVESYILSLPFKEEVASEKEKYAKLFASEAIKQAKAKNRAVSMEDLQKFVKPLVTSFEPSESYEGDDPPAGRQRQEPEGYQRPTPEERLETIQKQIDKLLAKPKYNMHVERSLNILRDQEKALKRTIR
ncbi:hypothetical protein WJR50_32855 [Catalinimonas sp. 4WD22]|uniref:hypothetical protein n=1 Tax=Catalinimonas locisalis TaxID=3133978 RepID=UPI00310174BC